MVVRETVVSEAVAHRIPAGWYRDKDEPSRRRWWDGAEWTEYYAPATRPQLTTVDLIAPRPGPTDAHGSTLRKADNLAKRMFFVMLVTLAADIIVVLSILEGIR